MRENQERDIDLREELFELRAQVVVKRRDLELDKIEKIKKIEKKKKIEEILKSRE